MLIKFAVQEDNDWGFIAMVLDRFFLGIFTLASLLGTVSMQVITPLPLSNRLLTQF